MTLGLKPLPQILPALLIERKSVPRVIPAAVSQASIPAFTQSGTGIVRMWPPLQIRSAMTQCSSLCCMSSTRIAVNSARRHYASTTINLRLAAVRRLAYEAADCGLLSADLAAGIRRVKGAKRLGVPVGNWLTVEQGKRLLMTANETSIRGKRDYATLAILLGCGLRRAELTALRVGHLQQREGHWAIVDLAGKGG